MVAQRLSRVGEWRACAVLECVLEQDTNGDHNAPSGRTHALPLSYERGMQPRYSRPGVRSKLAGVGYLHLLLRCPHSGAKRLHFADNLHTLIFHLSGG